MPQTTDAFSVVYPVKCPGVGMGEGSKEMSRSEAVLLRARVYWNSH